MRKTRSREFWKSTPLENMSRRQWESLCDGCARCCLRKVFFEDTKELVYTRVACRYLDVCTLRCTVYAGRSSISEDCLIVTPENISSCLDLLPDTCAYRLLAQGRDLPWWHPLVSGDRDTVHRAGISVKGKVLSEEFIAPEEIVDHIIDWVRC